MKKEHIDLINSLEDVLSVCMQDRVVSHCKNDFRLEWKLSALELIEIT